MKHFLLQISLFIDQTISDDHSLESYFQDNNMSVQLTGFGEESWSLISKSNVHVIWDHDLIIFIEGTLYLVFVR